MGRKKKQCLDKPEEYQYKPTPQIGIYQICEGEVSTRQIQSAEDVYEEFKHLSSYDREAFFVLHLNTKNYIISTEMVSLGSLNGGIVHPREVFKGAILQNAAAIICVHNHPSGDSSPSGEDCNIAFRLEAAGKTLGIELRDMVIIGKGEYCSRKGGGRWLHGPQNL